MERDSKEAGYIIKGHDGKGVGFIRKERDDKAAVCAANFMERKCSREQT